MKKKNKKIEKNYSQDHVVVILEEMQSQFKAFGDGQQIIEKRLGIMEDKFSDFQEETRSNFKAVANTLTEINDKLDNHEDKINNLQEDVTEIKHKLSEKVDKKEFHNLENRVVKIERLALANN